MGSAIVRAGRGGLHISVIAATAGADKIVIGAR
jgi:hypothetical protein